MPLVAPLRSQRILHMTAVVRRGLTASIGMDPETTHYDGKESGIRTLSMNRRFVRHGTSYTWPTRHYASCHDWQRLPTLLWPTRVSANLPPLWPRHPSADSGASYFRTVRRPDGDQLRRSYLQWWRRWSLRSWLHELRDRRINVGPSTSTAADLPTRRLSPIGCDDGIRTARPTDDPAARRWPEGGDRSTAYAEVEELMAIHVGVVLLAASFSSAELPRR